MATLTTRTIVCDVGLDKCDNSRLLEVELRIDRQRSKQVLCAKHAAQYVRLQEKMGGGKTPRARGKIYTPEEIAARRRAAKKA